HCELSTSRRTLGILARRVREPSFMSSAALDNKFPCPACGKQYTWRPQLAGKRAKCTCGSLIHVPKSAPAPPALEPHGPTDLYDIAAPPPQPVPPLPPPASAIAPPPP